ncbi:MAG: metal ABC transporter permease [Ruminococcaceae bacterium]|nr:metal ABC transporter permease [Oscillospiraceae bacterium]
MINAFIEMMSYSFLLRAVIVGVLVSLCASLLGVSLVLKRYSMIGDGLSHVGFGALAIAAVMNISPLKITVPVVAAAAFILLRLSENSKLKGDAAVALISTSSLAAGVMAVSLTKGVNVDLENYLFGSILALTKEDVYISAVLSAVVIFVFIFFYNKIFSVTFDESFAGATGVKTGAYNMVLALLTAITVVLGMRLMGTLLISALIIFPALSSMRVFKSFFSVTVSSAVISVVCFILGITFSYAYSTPPGASVVTINLAVFALFSLVGMVKGMRK